MSTPQAARCPRGHFARPISAHQMRCDHCDVFYPTATCRMCGQPTASLPWGSGWECTGQPRHTEGVSYRSCPECWTPWNPSGASWTCPTHGLFLVARQTCPHCQVNFLVRLPDDPVWTCEGCGGVQPV